MSLPHIGCNCWGKLCTVQMVFGCVENVFESVVSESVVSEKA